MPGSRPAVVEHEEWGERARNVLLVIGVIELLALALRTSPKARLLHVASALVGLVGVFAVYETGKHGGELVYNYAGGVGLRSGDPQDKAHLFVATYHQAMADREAGRSAEAAELIATVTKRFPADPQMQMFAAESLLRDGKNAQAAIDALAKVTPPDGNRILIGRKATLQAECLRGGRAGPKAIAACSRRRWRRSRTRACSSGSTS